MAPGHGEARPRRGRCSGFPRRPPTRQGQTAAHADLDSLTIGGDHPTIVAFLVARTVSGTLVYESLNVEDHATYVFHDPAMSVAQLDLALMLIGFHIEVLAGDVAGIGSRYAEAVRRLPHLARLAARLPGAGHPRRRMAGSARADDLLRAVTPASPGRRRAGSRSGAAAYDVAAWLMRCRRPELEDR